MDDYGDYIDYNYDFGNYDYGNYDYDYSNYDYDYGDPSGYAYDSATGGFSPLPDDYSYDFGYGEPEKQEENNAGFILPFLLNPDINLDLGDVYDFGYGDYDYGDYSSSAPGGYVYDSSTGELVPMPADYNYDFGYGDYPGGGSTSASKGAMDFLLKNARGLFTTTGPDGKSAIDWNKLATAGAGLAGAYAGTQAKENVQRVGYQGSMPDYQAVRRPVSGTYDPNRRAGSSGQRYATDVVFSGPGGPTFDQALSLTAAQAADLQQFNQQNPAKKQAMAQGGMAQGLGRYLQGQTDGMADEIPSSIDGEQPAALSHGEFVIPADVVSHLGNGNSDAGAKKLYQMMDAIRMARTGTKKQGREIDPDQFTMGGLASAYAAGGSVQGYDVGGTVKPTYESNLSNYAGPYVTNMLGKGEALSELPYMGYSGPLTAGASNLQTQAFQKAGQLQTPAAVGQAANTAGNIAGQMQNLNYQPTQFGNQFQAPQAFKTGEFGTDTFGTQQAQQYMNPYLQGSLDPQLAEARRQAEISRIENAGRLTKAGAYGGSRQAIMEAEGNRNLGTNLANITGQGFNTAYQNAMAQFNADQNRRVSAQQAGEQSRQFGATQGLTAAQLAAQYGLQGQQAGEQSRQFGSTLGLQGLQGALSAAQAQGALGAQENQANVANLQQLSSLGNTQRDIESQGIAADYAQFQEERDYPYKMLQFQQGLLGSLPLATQGSTIPGTNTLQDAAGGAAALTDMLRKLRVID